MKSIGSWAFYGCSALTEVMIEPCVEKLEQSAFSTCMSLKKVVMGNSVTDCGFNVFFGCDHLTDVTLSNQLKELSDGMFWASTANGKTDLTELVIPASVTSIRRAFIGSGVQKITFKDSAPNFTSDAFQGVTATVCYPKNDSTWTESVRQSYKGTITWAAY